MCCGIMLHWGSSWGKKKSVFSFVFWFSRLMKGDMLSLVKTMLIHGQSPQLKISCRRRKLKSRNMRWSNIVTHYLRWKTPIDCFVLHKIYKHLFQGYHPSNKAYSGKVALSSLQNSSRNKIIDIGEWLSFICSISYMHLQHVTVPKNWSILELI